MLQSGSGRYASVAAVGGGILDLKHAYFPRGDKRGQELYVGAGGRQTVFNAGRFPTRYVTSSKVTGGGRLLVGFRRACFPYYAHGDDAAARGTRGRGDLFLNRM
jgi:hypothetical protein